MSMSELQNIYYVYKYTDKDDIPFYMGMGKDYRYKDHLWIRKDKKYKDLYFYRKLNKMIDNDEKFNVEIIHKELSRKEAIEIEKYYIAFYGRKCFGLGTLCNLTEGGDGGVPGIIKESTREKLRLNWLGKKHSPESIEKMRKVQRGLKHRKLTEEQLVVHSQVVVERWKSPEYREKVHIKILENYAKRIEETKKTGEVVIWETQFDIDVPRNALWRISACCRGKRKAYRKSTWRYI